MLHPFDKEQWYKPERDGNLEDYLSMHDGGSFPLFKGPLWYQRLWEGGHFVPNYSIIRIMWNVGREDEHYTVISKSELKGIEATVHGGKPGIFNPKELLLENGPLWEAHHLAIQPESE